MRANTLKHLKQILKVDGNDYTISLIKKLFNQLTEYWEIHDIHYGLAHKKVFSAIYLENKELTYNEIAHNNYISAPTIKRYVAIFNEIAIKLISKDYFELLNIL